MFIIYLTSKQKAMQSSKQQQQQQQQLRTDNSAVVVSQVVAGCTYTHTHVHTHTHPCFVGVQHSLPNTPPPLFLRFWRCFVPVFILSSFITFFPPPSATVYLFFLSSFVLMLFYIYLYIYMHVYIYIYMFINIII